MDSLSGIFQLEYHLLILLSFFYYSTPSIMALSLKRPHSTQPKQRSFFIDKKSTISTRQTSRQLAKSFIIKPHQVNSIQKQKTVQNLSQSAPIQVYFNPQYRSNYIKKVIDTFFTNIKDEKPQNNLFANNKLISPNKLSIRNRMIQWKRKTLIIQQFGSGDTGKFIRSSPKKSIISDLSEEKSIALVADDSDSILFQHPPTSNKDVQEKNATISINSNSFKSIKEFTNYSKLRPLTVQNKKRKISREKQSNTVPVNQNFSVSLFFNQRNSPREKMRKQIRKLIDQNQYFEQYAVYEDKKIKYKLRKYITSSGQINPLFQRQNKIRKRGIKSLWDYTKFQNTLQYPLSKSIKQMVSEQFCYGQSQSDKYMEIYPKQYYNKLFVNKNQELIDIIKSMANLIINNKGKVLIAGGFNLKNLFRIDQKQFYLKDLGTSALLEEIKIRDRVIKHFYQPIWKENGSKGKWLVNSECIPPECLDSYSNCDFSWMQQSPEAVMAAQIWSLGCMILELITLIPLNCNIRSQIKNRSGSLRRGYLSVNTKDPILYIEQLKRKQNYLQNIMNRKIQFQLMGIPLQLKVLDVLRKMIVYDGRKRISPKEVIQFLS